MLRSLAALACAAALTFAASSCKVSSESGSALQNDGGTNQINGVPVPRNMTAIVNCLDAAGVPAPVMTAIRAAAGTNGELPEGFIANPPDGLVDAIGRADAGAGRVLEVTNIVLQCVVNTGVVIAANLIAPWHNRVEAARARAFDLPPVAQNTAAVEPYQTQHFCNSSGGYYCWQEIWGDGGGLNMTLSECTIANAQARAEATCRAMRSVEAGYEYHSHVEHFTRFNPTRN